MKRWLLLLWLLLPLPVLVWHFGPGQKWLARDQAHSLIQQAQQAEAGKNWRQAEELYREASNLARQTEPRLRLQMDMALARMRYRQGGAVDAMDLMDKVINDPLFHEQSAGLQQEARELAGRIHYYSSWVMRLEGAQRDLWMEEAELSRQNFRMLVEDNLASQTAYAQGQQTNLESAVRLQRMSLTELMGRPLPEEGQGLMGQGLSEQMARRRGQRGKGQPGIGENDDAREPAPGAGTSRFPGGPGS